MFLGDVFGAAEDQWLDPFWRDTKPQIGPMRTDANGQVNSFTLKGVKVTGKANWFDLQADWFDLQKLQER